MDRFEYLIQQVVDEFEGGEGPHALEAAKALWEYPEWQAAIDAEESLRRRYVDALAQSAYVFCQHTSAYDAVGPFERAFGLADETMRLEGGADSMKEAMAFQLGKVFRNANLRHSEVEWCRRTLELARKGDSTLRVLQNVMWIAQALEDLGRYSEAEPYYREAEEALVGLPAHLAADYIVPCAIFEIVRGEPSVGEAMLRQLMEYALSDDPARTAPIGDGVLKGARALGFHYAATGRPNEAMELSLSLRRAAPHFEPPEWAEAQARAVAARALVHQGRLDEALVELGPEYDGTEPFVGGFPPLEVLAVWADAARIHAALGRHRQAIKLLRISALGYGAFIAHPISGDTMRRRFYWLQHQARYVHEMASIFLSMPFGPDRETVAPTVGNSLLQLKGSLYLALEMNRLPDPVMVPFVPWSGGPLLRANRLYAAAARRTLRQPDDWQTLLDLEDALFLREEVERTRLSGDFIPDPVVSEAFSYDFRNCRLLGEDEVLVDYSLVRMRQPKDGLAGPPLGTRYVGVRLVRDGVEVLDLGEAEALEEVCSRFVAKASRRPIFTDSRGGHVDDSDAPASAADPAPLSLSEAVYEKLLAPFEPLPHSLLISPDGPVAAVPFHAVLLDGRYLCEDYDIAYCHSLLGRESLTRRQMSPMGRVIPSFTRNALLVGNPRYPKGGKNKPLPSTRVEVEKIAELLLAVRAGDTAFFDDVRVLTGRNATTSELLDMPWPKILHIAAHGGYIETRAALFEDPMDDPAETNQRWEGLAACPLPALDRALVGATLTLACDRKTAPPGTDGACLTALEISSLNLINSHALVLSACETGLGATEHAGTGVLGFQYAALATFAQGAVLSLWSVPDLETARFMTDFYGSISPYWRPRDAYLHAMRSNCRRDGRPVSPYSWAAFVLLDQSYYQPLF